LPDNVQYYHCHFHEECRLTPEERREGEGVCTRTTEDIPENSYIWCSEPFSSLRISADDISIEDCSYHDEIGDHFHGGCRLSTRKLRIKRGYVTQVLYLRDYPQSSGAQLELPLKNKKLKRFTKRRLL